MAELQPDGGVVIDAVPGIETANEIRVFSRENAINGIGDCVDIGIERVCGVVDKCQP